jgi:magnesium chelatase subunit ChlD-like protein
MSSARSATWPAQQYTSTIAWLPTLVAKGSASLQAKHLRHQPAMAGAGRLHCIVLDTSGSMRQRGRLALAKGYAAYLIEQAARQGDDIALMRFGGQGWELVLPPCRARRAGGLRLRPLGGGGGTPLVQALAQADRLLQRAVRNGGCAERWLWLLTDGRTLEKPEPPKAAQHVVIVDFDDPNSSLGRCQNLAKRWGAEHRSAFSAARPY